MTLADILVGAITRRPLHDGWRVHAVAGPIPAPLRNAVVPAAVPGVVHLDLLAAGLIPDPYLDENESSLSWIGLLDWTYQLTFEVGAQKLESSQRHDLVFEGLDTVASVRLNDVLILDAQNQHRTHRVDVGSILRVGGNDLDVAFRSPVAHANAQSLAQGARPSTYPSPFEAIRKSACSFGWDWGIATCASGIWRPVHLESWSHARLSDVRVVAAPDGRGGIVTVDVEVERALGAEVEVEVEVAGVRTTHAIDPGERAARVLVRCEEIERWWPAGHGDQPLYDVAVRLRSIGGVLYDEVSRRVGFRTVRWDSVADDDGTSFQLVVNDREVFVKGVNWIPDDAFPSRVGRERYAQRLAQARRANVNLIRVWGGGIYESDDFYELCDELGLLTWQDFLFACAAYSEDPVMAAEVEAEARQNVARISHHASLVLLAGNNENLWGYEDWNWKQLLDGKSWGAGYYYELLPAVVSAIAPHVTYIPGSPFSPGAHHPNSESHGTTHLWEQWNRQDWTTYRDHVPRFVAEFGWQGPPTWSTLVRAIHDDPLTPKSAGMIAHQKAEDGNLKLTAGLVPHFPVPDDMEDWHWAMQLNQANAVRCALEWFRSHAPRTAGAVVWQLNDCWPVTSWAAIDGDGREKPLYHALQRAFAAKMVTIEPQDAGLVAALCNDTDIDWTGRVVFERHGYDGSLKAVSAVNAHVGARSVLRVDVPEDVAEPGSAADELITATALDARAEWFFVEPRDSHLAPEEVDVQVERDDEAFRVTVTARTLVRDMTLLVDKIAPEAQVDSGLATLLPGETTTFRVTGVDALDVAAVSDPRVLRTGNQLITVL